MYTPLPLVAADEELELVVVDVVGGVGCGAVDCGGCGRAAGGCNGAKSRGRIAGGMMGPAPTGVGTAGVAGNDPNESMTGCGCSAAATPGAGWATRGCWCCL